MYNYSSENDNLMLSLDNYCECDDYDDEELGCLMGKRNLDLLYIIADKVFGYAPSFSNKAEKYSLENERFVLCYLASEFMDYVRSGYRHCLFW